MWRVNKLIFHPLFKNIKRNPGSYELHQRRLRHLCKIQEIFLNFHFAQKKIGTFSTNHETIRLVFDHYSIAKGVRYNIFSAISFLFQNTQINTYKAWVGRVQTWSEQKQNSSEIHQIAVFNWPVIRGTQRFVLSVKCRPAAPLFNFM